MEGQINESRFLRDLVDLGYDSFTGAIRLEREDVIKILYLEDGQITSASTNDPSESVDEILLRGKKVTREHIQQALVKRKSEETLGDALLSAGFISRKELRWARRHQIVEVLRSTIGSEEWHYTVVPDYVSSRTAEGTSFPVAPILIELIVTDPDRKRIDQRLDGGEVRLRKSPTFDARYGSLGLNEDADRVAERVDGRKTATEIAAEAGGNGFMNLKLLAALRLLGLLEENPKAKEQLEISFESRRPEKGILPGIEPEPEAGVNVPAWEVEPIPGAGNEASTEDEADLGLELDLGPSDPAEEWEVPPEPSSAPEEPEAAAEISLETESGVADETSSEEEIELPPREEESAPEEFSPVDLPEDLGDGSSEFEEGLESEVGKALEWSPPPPEDQPAEPFSYLPPEEELDAMGASGSGTGSPLSSTERSGSGSAWKWIGGVVVVLLIAGAAWFLMRGEGEQGTPSASTTEDETVAAVVPMETVTDSGADEVNAAEPEPEPESTAGTVEVPSSPPVRPAPSDSDPIRARYDQQADQFASGAARVPYTIQFEIVCQTGSVSKAVEDGGSAVWFIPIDFQGRACYRVFWGRYDTEAAAREGIDEIPGSLRGSRPVIVQPGRLVE